VVVSGQPHATAVLPPRKMPRYPLDRRLDGSRTGLGREAKRKDPFTAPVRNRNPVVWPAL